MTRKEMIDLLPYHENTEVLEDDFIAIMGMSINDLIGIRDYDRLEIRKVKSEFEEEKPDLLAIYLDGSYFGSYKPDVEVINEQQTIDNLTATINHLNDLLHLRNEEISALKTELWGI